MAGTRALFASIGASAALVAAAALTLLAVSAVFAFGGWGDFASPTAESSALVFASTTKTTQANDGRARARRIVAPAPVRTTQRPERRNSDTSGAEAAARNVTTNLGRGRGAISRVTPLPPPPPPLPPPPAATPSTGDRVTKAGETLSGSVQSTGAALAEVTQPLRAPVSAAVQQVLNLIAEAVRRTAEGLGGAVDSLLAPK